jgi:hypothetical protein
MYASRHTIACRSIGPVSRMIAGDRIPPIADIISRHFFIKKTHAKEYR